MKITLLALAAGLLAACSSTPVATEGDGGAAPAAALSMTSTSPEAIAHLKKGEVLLDNLRPDEAAAEFSEALKLDPNFQLARAYHGVALPGAEGLNELERARGASAGLPEGERLLIEGMAAERRGDFTAARAAYTRLTEALPNEWRGHFVLGQRLLLEQKYDAAVQSLKKATALNSEAGGAQNMLGYAAFRQGDVDGAIAAFTEYVRILPQEPNPQDSLAEALLGAGRFKESEAAFQKALQLAPRFWNAWQGTAYARFYSGDRAGGLDAFAKGKSAASRPGDRIALDAELAIAAAAWRDTAQALRLLDAAEKTDGAAPSDVAFIPVNRAIVLLEAGRAREALAPLTAAITNADSGKLPPGLSRNLRRQALRVQIAAQAVLGDAAAAEQTAAALDREAADRPDDAAAQSSMHYGRGQLALATGDVAGARAHFEQCSREDEPCKWQGVLAAQKANDRPGAAAAREQLLKVYQRDPLHLLIRTRLTATPTT